MRITILAVGKIKEKYLRDGIAEFVKRLGPFCRLEIKELDEERMPDDPSAAQKEQALAREGERLLKQLPQGSRVFVLDVIGKQQSSEELAFWSTSSSSSGRRNFRGFRRPRRPSRTPARKFSRSLRAPRSPGIRLRDRTARGAGTRTGAQFFHPKALIARDRSDDITA